LVVADLHGHRTHFDALLVWAETQGVDHTVLLGDYCDNGPDMLGLFERLVNRPKTTAIVGNHDLAALRAAGLGGAPPNPEWYERWNSRYGKTLAAVLGAVSADDLADRFPAGVRVWLESLPWVAETPRYCFVHAGMEPESLRPQVQALHARTLPDNPEFHPAPISKKELAKVGSLAWDRVVVSGHKNLHGPCAFVGPNRICLSAEVDQTGVLHAVILPQRRFVAIGRDLVVRDVQPPGGEAA
jgi:serine/threonine protein phosphatase 1